MSVFAVSRETGESRMSAEKEGLFIFVQHLTRSSGVLSDVSTRNLISDSSGRNPLTHPISFVEFLSSHTI